MSYTVRCRIHIVEPAAKRKSACVNRREAAVKKRVRRQIEKK